jgi:hypothetical protein
VLSILAVTLKFSQLAAYPWNIDNLTLKFSQLPIPGLVLPLLLLLEKQASNSNMALLHRTLCSAVRLGQARYHTQRDLAAGTVRYFDSFRGNGSVLLDDGREVDIDPSLLHNNAQLPTVRGGLIDGQRVEVRISNFGGVSTATDIHGLDRHHAI